jgi:hypothetical protein
MPKFSSCFKEVTLLNTLNAKLNPICHFLALLGAHHILHISRIRVNKVHTHTYIYIYYITDILMEI